MFADVVKAVELFSTNAPVEGLYANDIQHIPAIVHESAGVPLSEASGHLCETVLVADAAGDPFIFLSSQGKSS